MPRSVRRSARRQPLVPTRGTGEGDPAAVVPDDPAAVVPDDPAGVVPDDPAAVVPDDPAAVVPDDPAAVVPDDPAAVVPDDPAPLPSVMEEAIDLLKKVGVVAPSRSQVNKVMPLIEIRAQVAASTTKTKKNLFKQRKTQKRHGQQSAIAKAISICQNSVFPSRNPKKATTRRRMAESKVSVVDEFLGRDDNCFILPDKKYYRKDKGEFVPVKALVDTLRNLHQKFVIQTGLTLSFPTFCKARDRSTIKACIFLKRSVCLCKPHANMSMMLEAVPGLPNSTSQLAVLSDEEVKTALNTIPRNLVSFKMWDEDKRKHKGRNVYHTVLRKTKLYVDMFKIKFTQDLVVFREHHHRVQEQYNAVRKLKEVFHANHIMIQMDYSENWSTSFMREIQAASMARTK